MLPHSYTTLLGGFHQGEGKATPYQHNIMAAEYQSYQHNAVTQTPQHYTNHLQPVVMSSSSSAASNQIQAPRSKKKKTSLKASKVSSSSSSLSSLSSAPSSATASTSLLSKPSPPSSEVQHQHLITAYDNSTFQRGNTVQSASSPTSSPPSMSLSPLATESSTASSGTDGKESKKCTRCKRWKGIDYFVNDDPNLPAHSGCLECRENARKYGQSEYGKATRRNYNKTEKAKETRKKYAQSEKGKESRRKYAQTEKAKEARRKYNQSEKAKETRKRRAAMHAQNQKKQVSAKETTSDDYELIPSFIGNIAFDPSQEPNENEKAFWQTVTKTIYDRSKEHYDKFIDDHSNLEVDIRFKYRRTK